MSRRADHASGLDPEWARWPDDKLLDLRLCDLSVRLEGSPVWAQIERLYEELASPGLRFRPHCWLSDDWFTPDGVPGIAVPFYLVHPRLMQLEQTQMLDVEGGTRDWCLRILRHEAGHAIENAYRLRRRKRRQALFGPSSQPYPKFYTPRPYSKSYVMNLERWYAQSHPDEDFAETFAVWLTPSSEWRERYAGWPALKKLEYVDQLMAEIANQPPQIRSRARVDPLAHLRRTLREHYARKRRHYGIDHLEVYDRDLRRLFSDAAESAQNPPADRFINRMRKQVRRTVAEWTGEYQYTIDQVVEAMIRRCHELRLHLAVSEDQAKLDFIALLTVQTMNYLRSGRHRVPL